MTAHTVTRLMPAGTTQKTHPTPGKDRKGVNTVALFESMRSQKRASMPLSEVEKAVRRESVDLRRQQLADKAAVIAALYGVRSNR